MNSRLSLSKNKAQTNFRVVKRHPTITVEMDVLSKKIHLSFLQSISIFSVWIFSERLFPLGSVLFYFLATGRKMLFCHERGHFSRVHGVSLL